MSDEKLTKCLVLLETQASDIAEIKADVKAQNGRVRKLEDDSLRIKTLWSVGVVAAGFMADSIKHRLGL